MNGRDRRKIILAVMGGGKDTGYILLDNLVTDAAAPLTTPRTCEPGPGTLAITDAANRLSISSGIGTLGAGSGTVALVYDNLVNFNTPVGVLLSTKNEDAYFALGFNSSTTAVAQYMRDYQNYVSFMSYSNWVYAPTTTAANFVRGGIIKYSDHYIAVIKDGVSQAKYKIIGAFNFATAARYCVLSSNGATSRFNFDDLCIFTSKTQKMYSDSKTSVTAGDIFTAVDSNFCMAWTYVAQNGVVQDIMFRRIDDDNTLILRMTQATNKAQFFKKVSGTETALGSEISYTQVAGNSYQMSLCAFGTRISAFLVTIIADATNQTEKGIKFSHDAASMKLFPEYVPVNAINLL